MAVGDGGDEGATFSLGRAPPVEVVVERLDVSEKPATALSVLESSGAHELITPGFRVGWALGLTVARVHLIILISFPSFSSLGPSDWQRIVPDPPSCETASYSSWFLNLEDPNHAMAISLVVAYYSVVK